MVRNGYQISQYRQFRLGNHLVVSFLPNSVKNSVDAHFPTIYKVAVNLRCKSQKQSNPAPHTASRWRSRPSSFSRAAFASSARTFSLFFSDIHASSCAGEYLVSQSFQGRRRVTVIRKQRPARKFCSSVAAPSNLIPLYLNQTQLY